MAHPSTSTVSYLGMMGVGAIISNEGMRPVTNEITSASGGVAQGILNKVKTAADQGTAQGFDSGAIRALGTSPPQGNGAFTGRVPLQYTATLGYDGLDSLNAHANLMFGTSVIQMIQTFNIANGFVATSAQVAPTLEALSKGVDFGKQPGLDRLEYPADGIFGNYLGNGYQNYEDVITNGVSTLVEPYNNTNIGLLAQDLANIGTAFSLENASNLGNPGQIINALDNAKGLDATGMSIMLSRLGLQLEALFNVADSSYNDLMQSALEAINQPQLIQSAQLFLGSNIANMTSLGDYTNFDLLFVNSKDVITFSSISELRTKLNEIELGGIQTVAQLSSYIQQITSVDLPTVGNSVQFVNPNLVASAVAKYLGGTGANGRVTISDMIGILGGIGVKDSSKSHRDAITRLFNAGELTTLIGLLDDLILITNGGTTTGSPGNKTVSSNHGLVITNLQDADLPDAYLSCTNQVVGLAEQELYVIMAKANVLPDVNIAIDNWVSTHAKIISEKDFQSRTDMNYGIRTNFSDLANSFVTNLKATVNEPGKSEIVRGMIDQSIAEGQVGGEFMRMYLKEIENRAVGDNFDIRWRAAYYG